MKKLALAPIIVLLALGGWHLLYSYRYYNVILITTDTLRSDHLSCYNPKAPKTANFDRLAAESVLFERAYTTIPITLPAHTAMLTSHAPHNLGLFNNGETYDGRYPLLTETLAEKGYHTGAFLSLGVLKKEFGLGSSFQHYEDSFDDRAGRYYKTADEVNAVALPWIEKEKDHPFFAWVHYSDPHEPYVTADAPPDTEILVNGESYGKYSLARKDKIYIKFRAATGATSISFRAITRPGPKKIQEAQSRRYLDQKMVLDAPQDLQLNFGKDWRDIKLSSGGNAHYFQGEAALEVLNNHSLPIEATLRVSGGVWGQRLEEVRANYEAEVQYLDHHLGIFLDRLEALGLADKTIVILTSDHGEGLKTHGYLGHVGNLHNEVVHVPFLIRYPNLGRRGIRSALLINHLEIMPTLLDLLHMKSPGPLEGGSLKRYVSRSPFDMFLAPKLKRARAFAETYAPEAPKNSVALVEAEMKLILTDSWKWEVYDTSQDPVEKRNLARSDTARFQSESILNLRRRLEEFGKDTKIAHSRRQNPQLDETQREMMDTLGYVNHGDKPQPNNGPSPLQQKDDR